jgi:hypothetical protein
MDPRSASLEDGGFVWGLKYNGLDMQKHEKIEKVKGARDDVFVGVLKKSPKQVIA